MPRRKPTSAGAAPGERAVLLTAALGTMLMPLNSTMIAVALPDVVDDLDVSLGSTAWLVSGYLIAQASLQPLAGKLGDRLGRRPLILAGLASFGLVSLGAALAPSLAVLIAFRVPQAVAGALVFPNAIALVRELLPEARRGTVFGMHRLGHRARGGGWATARRRARRARRLAGDLPRQPALGRGGDLARAPLGSAPPPSDRSGALRSRRRRRSEPAARVDRLAPQPRRRPGLDRPRPRRLRSCCSS